MALYAVLSLDSGHTLKSQTSYPATKFHTALDPDYSAFDIFYVDYHDRYEQFIEEVQFVSPSGQPFEYLAGLYYYRTTAKTDRLARTGTQGFLLFGSPTNTVLPSRSEEHTSELQSLMRLSYAFFFFSNITMSLISHFSTYFTFYSLFFYFFFFFY